jgi:hypothetical protein
VADCDLIAKLSAKVSTPEGIAIVARTPVRANAKSKRHDWLDSTHLITERAFRTEEGRPQ